ncbi:SH3 domain-containing protein [Propionibacteriaceae bacterium Y2011]
MGVVAAVTMTAGIAATASMPSATADGARLTTWTALNVRSGPGLNHQIVGGLYPGQLVTADGVAQNGWTPVKFNGKRAWLSSRYVKAAGGRTTSNAADSTTVSGKPAGRKTTTALNVRTGPSTGYRVVTVLARGTTVATTGAYRNGYAEIRYGGHSRWVATQYLSDTIGASSSGSSTLPSVTGTRIATTALMIRTNSSSNFHSLGDVPRGTKLSITGKQENGVAQIIYNGAVRWVNAHYLARDTSGPAKPALPKVVGHRWATTALMVRTTSTSSFKNLGDVPTGTKLAITGVQQNGVAQIVHNGAVRWVNARYLSTSAPRAGSDSGPVKGTGLSGLTSRTGGVLDAVHNRYPSGISWYNGVRPDSLPDHPSGRALDVMLANYQSSAANKQGWEMANWLRANAGSLGIEYIIYDQRIWNVKRNSEGWRWMADRGSDNANHKNHIHITTRA